MRLTWLFCFSFLLLLSQFSFAFGPGEFYYAFNHHNDKDQEFLEVSKLMEGSLVSRDFEGALSLKRIVDSAYTDGCSGLEDSEQPICADLVQVLMDPFTSPETLQSSVGKILYTILVRGNFTSPVGKAIQKAFLIDPLSLNVTSKFYQMGKGHLNFNLLPCFRYYATYPKTLIPTHSVYELIRDSWVRLLNKELEDSFFNLARAHQNLAEQKISYTDFFKAYRRHFTANYFLHMIERRAQGLDVQEEERAHLAVYNRGLFRLVLPKHAQDKQNAFASLISFVRWIEGPQLFLAKSEGWGFGTVSEEDCGLIQFLLVYQRNGLLDYWENHPDGKAALLRLQEAPFYLEEARKHKL